MCLPWNKDFHTRARMNAFLGYKDLSCSWIDDVNAMAVRVFIDHLCTHTRVFQLRGYRDIDSVVTADRHCMKLIHDFPFSFLAVPSEQLVLGLSTSVC